MQTNWALSTCGTKIIDLWQRRVLFSECITAADLTILKSWREKTPQTNMKYLIYGAVKGKLGHSSFPWAKETVTSVKLWLNSADNWMRIDEKRVELEPILKKQTVWDKRFSCLQISRFLWRLPSVLQHILWSASSSWKPPQTDRQTRDRKCDFLHPF